MDLISLTIDGVQVEVAPGTTVLEAARQAGIRIPTLCYLKDINEIGACRMCVVDTGARALQAACVLPVAPNMKVKTNTPAVRAARKMNLELLLSNHDRKCLSCVRSTTCELQAMCLEYGVDDEEAFAGARTDYKIDDSSPSLVRDPSKCILCRRCIAVCDKVQNVGAIGMVHRGFNSVVAAAWDHPLGAS
ncbi:MAG: 2Fe-2S iron-sulfur cluster-binding protein, partial [Candidatus Fimadaptatus sp.]